MHERQGLHLHSLISPVEIVLFLLLWPLYLTIWIVTAMVGIIFSPVWLVLVVVIGGFALVAGAISIPFKIAEEIRGARRRPRPKTKTPPLPPPTMTEVVVVSFALGFFLWLFAARFGCAYFEALCSAPLGLPFFFVWPTLVFVSIRFGPRIHASRRQIARSVVAAFRIRRH